MAIEDEFQNVFDTLPLIAGKNYSQPGADPELRSHYNKIRQSYSEIAKAMGSINSFKKREFLELESNSTTATNGPLELNHNVANPVHTHVPWIVLAYKEVFSETRTDAYPVLLFDHSQYNKEGVNRIWFGLGMGVDDPGSDASPAERHQAILENFKSYSESSMDGWNFGKPSQRGHDRLNTFLDSFICWKCYENRFPDEVEFKTDVEKLLSKFIMFLKDGAVSFLKSNLSETITQSRSQPNSWTWVSSDNRLDKIFSLLLIESWIEKTLKGDYEFKQGMGYTNVDSNPTYIVRKPKEKKTPSTWKLYINNNGGRDQNIPFIDLVSIAIDCRKQGTYTSENSAGKDRTGIKCLVALLPEFFAYVSANTIQFLGNPVPSSPPISNPKVMTRNMTEEEKRLVDLLSVTNNVILDGVPGTGKTYIAKRISKLVAENTRGHCTGKFAITLHPSTSYEDFVEGLRPNQNRVETRNVNPIRVLIDHPSDDKLRMLVTLDASGATSWSPCTLEEVENGTPLIIKPVPTLEEKTDSKPAPSLFEITEISIDDATSNLVDSSFRPHAEQMFFFETPAQNPDAQFSIEDGFFLRVCKEALQYPEEEVYILIDEINRGNVPKVLGDLLSTMEDSKRIPSTKAEYQGEVIDVWRLDQDNLTITLPYSKRVFFVPENIKIIATRNTTDRSVVPLDAALRRRFSFFRLEPNRPDGMGNLRTYLDVVFDESTGLNTHLEENIGPDAMIGHSYFYDMETSSAPELIWRYSVLTQLVDVLDAANYLDKGNIEQINEILQPTHFRLQSTGENLHQKLRVRKLSEED